MDAATFWSAVGAIGTCVAAAAAVYALWPPAKKSLRLTGRWKGDLGDQWDFVAELNVTKGLAEGKIRWTFIECPPSLPWSGRVGYSGFELVDGTLERGILTLKGTKTVVPPTTTTTRACRSRLTPSMGKSC